MRQIGKKGRQNEFCCILRSLTNGNGLRFSLRSTAGLVLRQLFKERMRLNSMRKLLIDVSNLHLIQYERLFCIVYNTIIIPRAEEMSHFWILEN